LALLVLIPRGAWAACLAVALALTALAGCAPAPAPPAPPATAPTADVPPTALSPDVTAQIDRLGALAVGNGITGAIVSVSDPARGEFLRAYGTADTAGTAMAADMHY
jgi:D-alanyl-D-alanine carboxypeptidase